jgi:hypothetical protein
MVGTVYFPVGTENGLVADDVMGKIVAVVEGRGIPDVAGDDPAVAQAHGKPVIMEPEKTSPKAANAYQSRKMAIVDQIRIENIPNQHVLPGGTAVPVGFQHADLLISEGPVAIQPCHAWIEGLYLPVPDIIFVFPRRKVLRGYEVISIPDIFKHGIHITKSISFPGIAVYLRLDSIDIAEKAWYSHFMRGK